MSKHTPGPWEICPMGSYSDFDGQSRVICGDDRRIAVVHAERGNKEDKANARLIAAAPELLRELKLANKIIMNALNVMTTEQKLAWDELNTRDDLKDGWALTRNNVREAVIKKAEARQ